MSALDKFMKGLLEEQLVQALGESWKTAAETETEDECDVEENADERDNDCDSLQTAAEFEELEVIICNDNARIPGISGTQRSLELAGVGPSSRGRRNRNSSVPKSCPDRWDSTSAPPTPAPSIPTRMASYDLSPIVDTLRKLPATTSTSTSTATSSDSNLARLQRIMIV
jgi:hypothetical protein